MQGFEEHIRRNVRTAKQAAQRQEQERRSAVASVDQLMTWVWGRFLAAAQASDGTLIQQPLAGTTNEIAGGLLEWKSPPPFRALTIGRAKTPGHVSWSLQGRFDALNLYPPPRIPEFVSGVVPVAFFTPTIVDELILALLDQDVWGEGRIPDVTIPGNIPSNQPRS